MQYRYRAGQEACDDGDSESDDGCSSTCSIECGYDCTGGTATSTDECSSVCGDGIKSASEECDDNNSNDNDGCSSACIIEAGYSCSTPDCAVSVCGTACGDGCVYLRMFSFVNGFTRVCIHVFVLAFLYIHAKFGCIHVFVAVYNRLVLALSLLI